MNRYIGIGIGYGTEFRVVDPVQIRMDLHYFGRWILIRIRIRVGGSAF
jgi:hypothetical protein